MRVGGSGNTGDASYSKTSHLPLDVIARAWRDADFLASLNPDQLARLPESPVGWPDVAVATANPHAPEWHAGTIAASCSTVAAACSTVAASCSTVAATCSTVAA